MAPWLRLAALPPSLLCLIANALVPSAGSSQPWPYNLPPDAKYYPEDERLLKRETDIQQRLLQCPIQGVRKMSGDPGEKFYLDYWHFESEGYEEQKETDGERGSSDILPIWANATSLSLWTSFDSPARVHDTPTDHQRPRLLARVPGLHFFDQRDFKCPSDTSACTSINRPNSCCGTGSTCIIVQDTGLGDVGCCPNGQTCAGSLGSCAEGYTDCPNNPGGGCCIPGYACFEVGCVQTNTATQIPAPGPSTTTVTSYTTITPSAPTTSTSRTTTSSSSSSSTSTTLPPAIVTVTRTVTVTSSTPSSLTCSTGYRSCPASLGGGCCPTDRECGSANCPATTTTGSAEPPVRPTPETTTTETTTTVPGSGSTSTIGCPTGFYACSAYYQGGCCQIGRDCGSTSCPASASTTLVNSNGITIVAPTGSGITAPASLLTGSCARGWATCAPSVGGGCCPSGYACETATCAAASGGSDVGKLAPESGAVRAFIGGGGAGMAAVVVLMNSLVGILGVVL
ncbi:uncharacterized protein A1O9_07565 [Exophiala aquamarina CBS 119918]|uniref:GPI anchored protein n=1 Tax=Exophiala aquamarina CBS 119918 TaxID=1182545 RepID=A0A072PKC9_9EURO|nr:uncharacterized protein A1O9_07565 [Exophiala aquamarina CBS 119918]KEF55985.1 hypothetical protein A1O9_07565 [Exophiala aquamarina CBS 119918]